MTKNAIASVVSSGAKSVFQLGNFPSNNLFGGGANFDGGVDWVGAFATAGNGNAGQLGNGDQRDFGIQIHTKFMFKKKYKGNSGKILKNF